MWGAIIGGLKGAGRWVLHALIFPVLIAKLKEIAQKIMKRVKAKEEAEAAAQKLKEAESAEEFEAATPDHLNGV